MSLKNCTGGGKKTITSQTPVTLRVQKVSSHTRFVNQNKSQFQYKRI